MCFNLRSCCTSQSYEDCSGKDIVHQDKLFIIVFLEQTSRHIPGHQNECITPAVHARTGYNYDNKTLGHTVHNARLGHPL